MKKKHPRHPFEKKNIRKYLRDAAGKALAISLSAGMVLGTAAVSTAAETTNTTASATGTQITSSAQTANALEYMDSAVVMTLGEVTGTSPNTMKQLGAYALSVYSTFLGDPAKHSAKQIQKTLVEISKQLSALQSSTTQDFSYLESRLAALSIEENYQNFHTNYYDPMMSIYNQYYGILQKFQTLVSAEQAYAEDSSDANLSAMQNAYTAIQKLYFPSDAHDTPDFNFTSDLQKLCMLISPYDFSASVDLDTDPSDPVYWGANQHTGNLMDSYYSLISKLDAFEPEAYNDMTSMYNMAAATLAYYVQALQAYVAMEAQVVMSTPAEDLESRYGITSITSEQQKEAFVDRLWTDFNQKYYKSQRALAQMISLHSDKLESLMRDYDQNTTTLSISDYQTSHKGVSGVEVGNDSRFHTSTPDKVGKTVTVTQFKPFYANSSSQNSYALLVQDGDQAISAKDLHYIGYEAVIGSGFDDTARSCDYENLIHGTTNGYKLLAGAGDLSEITGVTAYSTASMNLIGFLNDHGIATDSTITFKGTADYTDKVLKQGYFLITSTTRESSGTDDLLMKNSDEDFNWINISQRLNPDALSENNILLDSDDDLQSKESVDAQHVMVMYKGSPSYTFRVQGEPEADGKTYVSADLSLEDGTSYDPSKSYAAGTRVVVRLKVDDDHYITGLNLKNEADNSVKYDYITKWSSAAGDEYTAPTDEECRNYFDTLTTDADGAYTFTVPVSYANSYLDVTTASRAQSDYRYSASIQRDGRGVVSFADQMGLTTESYYAGDNVDITVTPYMGYTCTGITVMDTSGKQISVTDTTDSTTLAMTGISKKAKSFSFAMPSSDVTILATYENAYTVTLADDTTKSLLDFADTATGKTTENSSITAEAGDVVTLVETVPAGSYLSKLNIVEHDTNDSVPSKPLLSTDAQGKTTTGVTFVMPAYNVDVLAESSAIPTGKHAVTLNSGTGGSVNFVEVETDADGKPVQDDSGVPVIKEDSGVSAETKRMVSQGETVYFRISTLSGCELKDGYPQAKPDNGDAWTVNSGITSYGGGLYSFQMGDANVMVSALFTEGNATSNAHFILREKYGQGSILVSNVGNEDQLLQGVAGEKISVTATPADGYAVSSAILLGGTRQQIGTIDLKANEDGSSSGTFTMPDEDCIVYVSFKQDAEHPSHTMTIKAEGTGTGTVSVDQISAEIGGSASETVRTGNAVTISVTPGEQTVSTSLVLQYTSDGSTAQVLYTTFREYYGKQSGNTYTAVIPMPNGDVTLTADFMSIEGMSYYPVTTTQQGSGTTDIQIAEGGGIPQAVLPGTTVTVNAAAEDQSADYVQSVTLLDADGKTLQAIYTDDGSENGSVSGTFTMPEQAVVVNTVFAQKETLDKDGEDYLISSYDDLVLMAKNIQSAPDQYASASYRVTQDIDCGGKAWTLPIGTQDHPFNGTFEGNDYTISNLSINGSSSESANSSYTREMGLFGVIGEKGVVRHTSILDFTWSSLSSYAGGLAAINQGLIDYCSVGINIGGTGDEAGNVDSDVPFSASQAVISGIDVAGGIVALNQGIIRNTRNNAIVTGGEKTGGYGATIAGGIAGINEGTITNFYNLGHIFGSEYEGGAAGENIALYDDGKQIEGTGVISYGYIGWALETGDNKETTGQVVGNALSTDMTDVYYCGSTAAAGINAESGKSVEDSTFTGVSYKNQDDMMTQDFADLLNSNISGQKNMGTWTWQANKNYKFPRLEATQLKQAVWTGENGITITGNVHPDAQLQVKTLKSTDADYQALAKADNIEKMLGAWDISLRFANGRRATFEGNVTIHIPAEVANALASKNIEVLHLYNQKLHLENFTKNADGSIDLTVGHLSPFGLAQTTGQDSTNVEPASNPTKPDDAGKSAGSGQTISGNGSGTGTSNTSTTAKGVSTGDQSQVALYVTLLGLAGAAAAALVLMLLRKRRRMK